MAEDGSTIGISESHKTTPFSKKFDGTHPDWKLLKSLIVEGNYAVSKEFSNLSMNVAKQIAADFNEKIIGGSGAGSSAKSAYDVAKAYKLWSKKTMFQAVALSFKENIDRTSAIMSKAVKDLAPAAVQILHIRPNQVVQGAMQQQQGQEDDGGVFASIT